MCLTADAGDAGSSALNQLDQQQAASLQASLQAILDDYKAQDTETARQRYDPTLFFFFFFLGACMAAEQLRHGDCLALLDGEFDLFAMMLIKLLADTIELARYCVYACQQCIPGAPAYAQ